MQDAYRDSLCFVTSDDGDISSDAVGMAVQEVYRFELLLKRTTSHIELEYLMLTPTYIWGIFKN